MGVGAYLSLTGREVDWGWALIQRWALNNCFCLWDERLFEVGANSRLGTYSNKYGKSLRKAIPSLHRTVATGQILQKDQKYLI